MALPDFLLIGAPKAGTTALHVALARHPQLFLSAVKEPKFFLHGRDAAAGARRSGRREDVPGVRLAAARTTRRSSTGAPAGTLRGESTTLYLRDPAAHRRIAALLPSARLVAVVRDPVDRAHSNWTHLRSAGLEPEPRLRAGPARCEQRRVELGWAPFWRYLELGRYGEQLRHLYSVFPREQVHVVLYRDLRQHPAETLDGICAFLGVDTGIVGELPAENVTAEAAHSTLHHLVGGALRGLADRLPAPLERRFTAYGRRLLQREQRTRTPLTVAEREKLIPEFDADISLLESLTGLRLEHWRDPANGIARRPLDIRGPVRHRAHQHRPPVADGAAPGPDAVPAGFTNRRTKRSGCRARPWSPLGERDRVLLRAAGVRVETRSRADDGMRAGAGRGRGRQRAGGGAAGGGAGEHAARPRAAAGPQPGGGGPAGGAGPGAAGAVPATIAVLGGTPLVGLTAAELDRVCDPAAGLVKLSRRDLGPAYALGRDGATTVAATAALAAAAGIAVFATGGLGGVHREAGAVLGRVRRPRRARRHPGAGGLLRE